jgi:DNA-directed RNA polymerase specialized sigma subunit
MSRYINNKDFFNALVERKELLITADKEGNDVPQISNYLGECILKIANNLANKGNFNGYSFKDEMICDGIENCIKYFDKFDPVKSSNPFSYYTQIIYFAYLRRIAKEKQQYQLKHKIIQSVGNIVYELQEQDDDQEFVNSYREFLAEFSNAELPNTVRKVKVPKVIVPTCQTLDVISE